ncbi:hypothetical protein ACHAWF_010821 [Thalassiosira exigua]
MPMDSAIPIRNIDPGVDNNGIHHDEAKRKAEDNLAAGYDVAAVSASLPPSAKKLKTEEEEEAKRKSRLESNRKAARESRRRKKVLVEELQRSVIFFTRANAQLKQKNEGLESMLFAARGQLEGRISGGRQPASLKAADNGPGDRKPSASKRPASMISAPVATPPTPPPAKQTTPTMTMTPAQQASAAAALAQNNSLMANWLAMAQAQAMVPNPMAMQMGMFNPAMSFAAANPAATAGLMGMAAAGMGNPFMGQMQATGHPLQASTAPFPGQSATFAAAKAGSDSDMKFDLAQSSKKEDGNQVVTL